MDKKTTNEICNIPIMNHHKQLGRCPKCGNERINLTELVEWEMCAPCYIKVLRKSFDLLAADYAMDQIAKHILIEKVKPEDLGDGKFYFPESQLSTEVERIFKEYLTLATG
jgi:hypothetical protein